MGNVTMPHDHEVWLDGFNTGYRKALQVHDSVATTVAAADSANTACAPPAPRLERHPLQPRVSPDTKGRQVTRRGSRTCLRGEDHPRAKLNEQQVRIIRRLQGKLKLHEIGGIFGMSMSGVGHILARRRWRHVRHPGASAR
jgi:hypothetical protein